MLRSCRSFVRCCRGPAQRSAFRPRGREIDVTIPRRFVRLFATTISPEVSLSRRWTMPVRVWPASEFEISNLKAIAFASVPLVTRPRDARPFRRVCLSRREDRPRKRCRAGCLRVQICGRQPRSSSTSISSPSRTLYEAFALRPLTSTSSSSISRASRERPAVDLFGKIRVETLLASRGSG